MVRPNNNQIHWEISETIKILNYVSENLESWLVSPYSTCAKLKETDQTITRTRSIKSIYSKVYGMFRMMEDHLKTGKKIRDSVTWKDKEIYDMMKNICERANEKLKENGFTERRRGRKRRCVFDDDDDDVDMNKDKITK